MIGLRSFGFTLVATTLLALNGDRLELSSATSLDLQTHPIQVKSSATRRLDAHQPSGLPASGAESASTVLAQDAAPPPSTAAPSNAAPSNARSKPAKRVQETPEGRRETGYRGPLPTDNRRNTTQLARLLRGSPPANRAELKSLQDRIRELTQKILPVTVAIQVGRANGSGVIVDEAGHVLTAAHVAGQPNREAIIYLSDGRQVRGITLGMNQRLDAGLIKITDSGQWPHAPLGTSQDLREGQWCLATGHPGGYSPDKPRAPVLRWGRVLKVDETAILTDCTLVGGDSGGPLFDLQGNVIGIHSRIGKNLTINVHVPIDPYRDSWDRLVSGEAWNLMESESALPWMGVLRSASSEEALIQEVTPGSPAERAGIQAGDRIVRLEETTIQSFDQLRAAVGQYSVGDVIEVELVRGEDRHILKLTLAQHPGS